jgi:zinc carboxypeptidase/N-acetylmuramoyl-L-alanine amidase-like protein
MRREAVGVPSSLVAIAAMAAVLGSASSAAHPSLRPPIHNGRIPFGRERKRETAAYSRRHYGHATWRLRHPHVIVLHFTDTSTYGAARNTFASNAPELGELPGVCAHFIIGKQGTIHRIVPLRIRCRHTIGLNWTAIGIEMVQEDIGSSHEADEAILHRRPQVRAALRLVRWLKARYAIKTRDVIGHAMANSSPYFKDLEGWRNDHTDWLREDVRKFRRRLRAISPRVAERPGVRHMRGSPGRSPSARRLRFGRSVRGRPLVAERIGNPNARRRALIVGQIHGDEPAGRDVVRLLRRRYRNLRGAAIWTVKTVNPDGNRAGTRQNADGVDLNRNFPYRWEPSPASSPTYGGPQPFSEPETRAVRRLALRLRPDVSIWYHQPWDAVLVNPCHQRGRIQRRYARVAELSLSCRGSGLPGTAIGWENHRIAGHAFVVELAASATRRNIRLNARAAVRVARRP